MQRPVKVAAKYEPYDPTPQILPHRPRRPPDLADVRSEGIQRASAECNLQMDRFFFLFFFSRS